MSNQLESAPRKVFIALILASLAFQIFVGLLETGHDATRYGTLDSQGNPLGFNDPVTLGHMRIMFGNVTLARLTETFGWYGLLCCLAHLGGLLAVGRNKVSHRMRLAWFGAQIFLFPIGAFVLFWIWFLPSFLFAPFDGEAIQDGPINVLFAQGTWWLVSLTIVIHLLWTETRPRKAGQTQRAHDAKT